MKKFVVKTENGTIKAMFNDRQEARNWVAANDKFGDMIVFPVEVAEDGTLTKTNW